MLSKEDFVRISLEVNLFFQRIMKEHLFFIETNLTPVEPYYIMKARMLKQDFESLLAETTSYANGVISESSIKSNEFVTPYTLKAEEITSKLTGGTINTSITKAEVDLKNHYLYDYSKLFNVVTYLNNKSIALVMELIRFQKNLLSMTLQCKIFITLYSKMLKHDTDEAEYYLQILESLQNGSPPKKSICDELNFWNHIMEEHAQFIDGMLDPTEKDLKKIARDIAEDFEVLVTECIKSNENKVIKDSVETTNEIKNYKTSSVLGLLNCEIRSIIPPLLADHVLREANHYLRILKMLS